MIVNISSATAFVERLQAALWEGAALVGTDKRVGAITALALCIGLVLGAYLYSVVSRRGRIAAMRKDLDRIGGLQESILESVSRQLWTDRDLANLKRETYQKLNRTLRALSFELSSILGRNAAGNENVNEWDSEKNPPARKAIEERLDEFTDLVIPSHVAVSQQSLDLVTRFQSQSERLRQLTGDVASYGFFADLRDLVDDTRSRLLDASSADLRAIAVDCNKRQAD